MFNSGGNESQPNSPAIAALGNVSSTVRRRKIVVDTGPSFDLISRHSLSFDERSLIYETTPIAIRTANGVVTTSEAISIEVHH